MALTLKDLKRVRATLPPRLLFYGPPGMGKTSLAASFPDPVFLQIEDGTPSDLEISSFGKLDTFGQVLECLAALYTEDHQYGTVVVDSLDRLQPLVWASVCESHKWDSIEAPGYGRGYVEADYLWQDFIAGLNALRKDRGMAVVCIAHSDIERFDDPTAASYSRYQPRLHKRANAMILDEMDAVLFINREATIKTEDQGFNKKRVHAEGGSTVFMYTEGRPAYVAKNHYGMPPKLTYHKAKGFEAIAPYLPGSSGVTEEKAA